MNKSIRFLLSIFFITCLLIPKGILAASGLEAGMENMASQIVANSKAKNKRTIGISAFPHINGDYSELSNYIADELVTQLFMIPDADLEIVERTQLNKIFKELNLSTTGTVDAASIQQLGRLHGVDALVIGSIADIGEQIKISARLVDTETGRVFSAAGTTIPETGNVKELMQKILIWGNSEPTSSRGRKTLGGSSSYARRNSNKKGHGTNPFTLDLKQYDTGDVPEELGSVVIANGKFIKSRKVVKPFQDGYLYIKDLQLQGDFVIEFLANKLESCAGSLELIDSDETKVKWRFGRAGNDGIYLGESKQYIKLPFYNRKPKRYKIKAEGRVVKIFIDGVFFGSQIRDPSDGYDSLKCSMKCSTNELTSLTITPK